MTFRSYLAVGASLLMLAGCSNKYDTVTPEIQAQMMADLQAGKLTLDCGVKCHFTWLAQAPQLHQLDLAEKWQDLAVRVQQIGYGSDLAYYYMGQAAQGLGYYQASIPYYSESLAISTGQDPLLRCESAQEAGAGDNCQGVDLVSSIPVLVQASRDAIAKQQADAAAAAAPAPVHHYHHKPKPKPANTDTGNSGWAAPPPPASGGSTGGSGWAAPPPPPSQ